jgi:hypothetical protein
MGQMFGQLTNPGTALMSGASGGEPLFIGTPSQVQQHLNQSRDAVIKSGINNPVMSPKPQPAFPTQGTPSFQQAATAGAQPGGVNALSPGLNKAGKLMTLLTSGLQGALAGRAASEQATVASGGRRSGGAGMGFEAAQAYPWQQLGRQLGAQQQEAQTGVLQSEAQNVNIPGMGPTPGWLAKALGPAYIRGQAQQGAAQIGAQGKIGAAQIGNRFKVVPNVGLFDTQAQGGQGALIPGTEQGIVITPEIAKDYQLPEQFVGKPMSLSGLASVQRSSVFENIPEMTAEGPIIINRRTAQATPVTGPGDQKYGPTGLAMPKEVADINNPGQTKIVPAGQSFGQPGVGSASVQVPRAAARAEVPTKIGDQRVAFTTMIQHAELLRDAARALNNGDVQTLAGLKNAFKNEFGYSGPITAKAISDAYGGEVTNVIAKGHITDAEMAKTGKTLDPSKQNFATVDKVLSAYQSLAQSKMNMLNQQKQSAINQSQPKGAKQNDPMSIRP